MLGLRLRISAAGAAGATTILGDWGFSSDEHPHGDVRLGQAWMADVVRAFAQSPCYRRGALFVLAFIVLKSLPGEFVPSQDQSRFLVRLQTAVGSDITETDRLLRRAEAFMAGRPEVNRYFSVIGGFGGQGQVNTGVLFVTLVPPGDRKLSQQEFSGVVRNELNAIPGVRAVVQDLSQSGFTAQRGFPVEFSVRGPDWQKLIETSEVISRELAASGLVVDLDTDYRLGMPELRILPDRARAADLGVPIEDVATTLNALVGGLRVGKYSSGGRRLRLFPWVAASRDRGRAASVRARRVRHRRADPRPFGPAYPWTRATA